MLTVATVTVDCDIDASRAHVLHTLSNGIDWIMFEMSFICILCYVYVSLCFDLSFSFNLCTNKKIRCKDIDNFFHVSQTNMENIDCFFYVDSHHVSIKKLKITTKRLIKTNLKKQQSVIGEILVRKNIVDEYLIF